MRTVICLGLQSIAEAILISGGVDLFDHYINHPASMIVFLVVLIASLVADFTDFFGRRH